MTEQEQQTLDSPHLQSKASETNSEIPPKDSVDTSKSKQEKNIDETYLKELNEKLDELEIKLDSDELEILEELKKKSRTDLISLGMLYFKCHNILSESKLVEEIGYILSKFELKKDFQAIIESYETQEYGNYYTGLKIKDYVTKEREKMYNLIDIFFSIFKQSI